MKHFPDKNEPKSFVLRARYKNILPPQILHTFWPLSVDKDSLNYRKCHKVVAGSKRICSFSTFYRSQDLNTSVYIKKTEKFKKNTWCWPTSWGCDLAIQTESLLGTWNDFWFTFLKKNIKASLYIWGFCSLKKQPYLLNNVLDIVPGR